jgi:hypothetical protein
MLVKSLKEKERALNEIYSATGWYALLILDNPTSVNVTSVNISTDTITATGHDFVNGCRVFAANVGGGVPGGLAIGTQYRVINVAGNDFKLCTEANYNPQTKTGTAIDITSSGSGVTTITEQPLSDIDDLDVWVRKEVPNYYGTSRQAITFPSALINYNTKQVSIGPVNIPFIPTGGSITYRYFLVISGGMLTRGNSAGTLAGYEDFVFTQTIDSTGKIFQYGVVL